MRNIFVPLNNCGQENNKVDRNLRCYLEFSGFGLVKLQSVENSSGCLCEGFCPEIS